MEVYKRLMDTCKRFPDKKAIIFENNDVTYRELKEKIIIYEELLQQKKTDKVAIMMENSTEFVYTLYSLIGLKKEIYLFNADMDNNELYQKIKVAKIDTIIFSKYSCKLRDMHSLAQDLPLSLFVIEDGEFVHEHISCTNFNKVNKKECLIVQTTSGTIAQSKMAYRNNLNISSDMTNIINTLSYQYNDVIYCAVPMYHGYGLTMSLFPTLTVGATLIFERTFMVNRFITKSRNCHISIFIAAPDIFDMILKYYKESDNENQVEFRKMRYIISSGSPLGRDTAEEFNRIFERWINQSYGMMEASMISINLEPNKNNCTSVGKVVQNVNLKLWNNIVGVKGDNVSSNYLDRKLRKKNGYYITNDYGNFDEEGNLYIFRETNTIGEK